MTVAKLKKKVATFQSPVVPATEKRGRPKQKAEELTTARRDRIARDAAANVMTLLYETCRGDDGLMQATMNKVQQRIQKSIGLFAAPTAKERNDDRARRSIISAVCEKVAVLKARATYGGDDVAKRSLSFIQQLIVKKSDRGACILPGKQRLTGIRFQSLDEAIDKMDQDGVPVLRLVKKTRKDKLHLGDLVTNMWHNVCEEKKVIIYR